MRLTVSPFSVYIVNLTGNARPKSNMRQEYKHSLDVDKEPEFCEDRDYGTIASSGRKLNR